MNRPILRLYAVVVVLFALLVVFTSRWTVFEAKSVRAEAQYQPRALIDEQRVHRGDLRASDGSVLARSVKGRGGLYHRVYAPDATDVAQAIGYSFIRTNRVGLEASRNDELSGRVDSVTSILDQLRGRQRAGDDVVTTIDRQAQHVAIQALGARRGSVVALDPRTGAVRVMASTPTYDPNSVNDPARFRALRQDPTAPLVNRATQFGPAPGSTFKVVTASAAIDAAGFTPQSTVSGRNGIPISGVPLENDQGETFGAIDLTTALAQSVNTAWAQVAERVGKATLGRYMRRFGFDQFPPLDYPRTQMTRSGEYLHGRLIPPTSRYVDLGRMGIGQDKLAVTPLQMAMVAATVANGGTLMRPHLTDRVVDQDGHTVARIAPEVFSQVMRPSTASAVNGMMQAVVDRGTGTAAQIPGVRVAGKTGTAETQIGKTINNVWFIAFAPADRPRIAVAVTVAGVPGFGGQFAAPIAKQVMESLLR